MADFCTVADVAAFLRVVIAADDAGALQAVGKASAAIRNYCRLTLDPVAGDVATLDGKGGRELVLPEFPVSAVLSVTEDDILLVADDDYKWSASGLLWRVNRCWSRGFQNVQVTYDHGYDPVPDEIAGVAIRAAARAYQAGLRASATGGVAGITSEVAADYTAQYSPEHGNPNEWMLGASGAPILLSSEKEILNRYKAGEM